jgi:hypothetical protein
MALGAITVSDFAGRGSASVYFDALSLAGDGAYVAGGTLFEQLFENSVAAGRKILAILPIDCGGYIPAWDAVAGRLKLYYGDNNNAADGPGIEVANGDYSAVTLKLLVISK